MIVLGDAARLRHGNDSRILSAPRGGRVLSNHGHFLGLTRGSRRRRPSSLNLLPLPVEKQKSRCLSLNPRFHFLRRPAPTPRYFPFGGASNNKINNLLRRQRETKKRQVPVLFLLENTCVRPVQRHYAYKNRRKDPSAVRDTISR